MKEVKVLKNQVTVDIAIQELGDPERIMEVAIANDMNVTDVWAAGDIVDSPDDYDPSKRSKVILFKDDANKPASGETEEDEDVGEGIGFWNIEIDFIVS